MLLIWKFAIKVFSLKSGFRFSGFLLIWESSSFKKNVRMDLFSSYFFGKKQNTRIYISNHLLRLIVICNLFVSKENIFLSSLILHYIWTMLPDIIRLRFIFRFEVSLVQLHGHSFCLTAELQYFIETYFETKEILKYRWLFALCSILFSQRSLLRATAP